MELLAVTPFVTPDTGIDDRIGNGLDQATRHRRQRPAPLGSQPVCNLSKALLQAITLGRNRASARDVRVHARVVEDLCIAEDQHAVICTLDAMLAMATGMAARGGLVVCEAKAVRGKVVVRLRFTGEPADCEASEPAILDCDVRRDWPRIPPCH